MENLPELFTETKTPTAKQFAHGQGEGGNANRKQAVEYLEALIPGFLTEYESDEAQQVEAYVNDFMDYLRQKWGVAVLAFLLAPMMATAQQHEIKGQFYYDPIQITGFSFGESRVTTAPTEPTPRIHPDYTIIFGEIWRRVPCGPNSQPCHRWDGERWVYDECGCYIFACKRVEQCVYPLPPLSFFKISRQVYQA